MDLTRIDGIDVTTALVAPSEVGADMLRFASARHFTSWLGLRPGTKITGDKVDLSSEAVQAGGCPLERRAMRHFRLRQ